MELKVHKIEVAHHYISYTHAIVMCNATDVYGKLIVLHLFKVIIVADAFTIRKDHELDIIILCRIAHDSVPRLSHSL